MSTHRHLFRRQAETDHVVGPVLDALRAPAREGELRREDATVAAFHSARLTPPTSTRSDMSTTARSAATRAAIATGVVVALSTGGFALAATDHLPTLPDRASDKATASVAKNPATSAPTTAATTTATTAATTTETESEKSTPTPNVNGLCKAFQAHKKLDGAWLESAAFATLATAAGSEDPATIATYCVGVVGEPKAKPVKPTPTNKPTDAGKPTAKPTPTNKPTDAGKPTATPTPTNKPTDAGKPTAKPTPEVKGKSATAGTR